MKQAGPVGSPDEVTQVGVSGCARTAALCGRVTTERAMNAPLIVVDGKSFQLPLQVQTIPYKDLIEVLPSHRPDKPLDERVRARNDGD